jgi:hypothetical protein
MDKLMERFKGLSIGEKIIVIAGPLLFIDGFLPWYSVDFGSLGNITRSGWQSPGAFWSLLAILIGLAMAAVVVLKNMTDVDIPEKVGNFTWPKIFLGGGVVALLFVLIKLVNESSFLGFGFYLGIIATGALAVAGFLLYREEKAA